MFIRLSVKSNLNLLYTQKGKLNLTNFLFGNIDEKGDLDVDLDTVRHNFLFSSTYVHYVRSHAIICEILIGDQRISVWIRQIPCEQIPQRRCTERSRIGFCIHSIYLINQNRNCANRRTEAKSSKSKEDATVNYAQKSSEAIDFSDIKYVQSLYV